MVRGSPPDAATLSEKSLGGTPFSLDDVTSKIAYAYSKQQVFAWFGLFALVGVLGPLVAVRSDLAALAAEGVTALLGAGILALVFTQRDLKRINRTSLQLALAVLVVQALVAFLSWRGVLPHETPEDLASGVSLAAVAGALVVSYPQPVRRGDAVLYRPSAILDLSNARTLGFGAVFMIALGISALASPTPVAVGSWFDPIFVELGILALGAVGLVLFLLGRENGILVPRSMGVTGGAFALSIVGLANAFGSSNALENALVPFVGLGLLLVLVLLFAPRLNRGKTILGRRA